MPRKSQPLSPGPRVSSLTLDGRGVVAGPSLLPVGAPHHDVLGRAVKGGLLSRAAAGVEGRRGRLRRSAVGGRGRGRRVAAICALVSFAACCGRRKCCWEYDSTIRSQEMLFETSVQSNPDQAGPKPSHSRPAAKPPLEAPGLRRGLRPTCVRRRRGVVGRHDVLEGVEGVGEGGGALEQGDQVGERARARTRGHLGRRGELAFPSDAPARGCRRRRG